MPQMDALDPGAPECLDREPPPERVRPVAGADDRHGAGGQHRPDPGRRTGHASPISSVLTDCSVYGRASLRHKDDTAPDEGRGEVAWPHVTIMMPWRTYAATRCSRPLRS